MIAFERPFFLWIALAILPELALAIHRGPRFLRSIARLAGPARRARALAVYRRAAIFGTLCSCLFLASTALALAGPSWGNKAVRVERSGFELALVLDVSRSMEARDSAGASLGVNRREAAVARILSIIDEIPGAAFSLVLAKGQGVLLVPMTEDREALRNALEFAGPEAMTAPGTDLGQGIRAGLASFTSRGSPARLLILLSDGGDRNGSALAAAAEARRRGVRILALGFGGSEPVPVPGPTGAPLSDGRGGLRLQALEPELLRALAAASEGLYLEASASETPRLLAEELERAGRQGLTTEYRERPRRGLFTVLALLAFAGRMLSRALALASGGPLRSSRGKEEP